MTEQAGLFDGGKGKKGKTSKKVGSAGGQVRQEHSAGVLLFRNAQDQRLWLLLDYGKHWDYAKGHLEEGETAWQAAVREVREETGIKQIDRVGKFEQDMHYVFYSPKKGRIHKRVTYFVGRTRTETVGLSDEHTGYAWLPFAEAIVKLTYENAREILRAAEDYVNARS
jgi:bis(5'-nucleosidyl)-tetraphosphatase